ncbi:MAG: GntR family transcriptional regulator [Oscillospiraceae bacterium]|jgi:GntR family transcriptional regulator|nr:GntR family transcriptional regulator [Oscillospiraceae bacterium]
MKVVLSNASTMPIYEQIKSQIRAAVMSGELMENETLPSLRQLAKDLKISVLTTMRAYSELEQEGFITSLQGKGYYVMPKGSQLMREQLLREVERSLGEAAEAAKNAGLTGEELAGMLRLIMEVD